MRRIGWRKWVVALAFLLAVLVAGHFAVRTVRRAVYWNQHRDEPVRPWMSVRYVARSYRVPPPTLYQAIRVEPRPRDRRPLRELAREQGRPVEDLISELEGAISEFRRTPRHPPPPPRLDGGRSP